MQKYTFGVGFICVFLTSGLPLSAIADVPDWYLGASAGASNYSSVIDDAVHGSPNPNVTATKGETATGFSALAGYQFNDYVALEGQYFNMGTATFDLTATGSSSGHAHATFKLDGFGIAAVGFYPLTDSIRLFGRLGLDSTDLKEAITVTGSLGSGSLDQSASKTTYDVGVGLDFRTSPQWIVRLGYNQFHNIGDSNVTGSGNVSYVFLGALYRF